MKSFIKNKLRILLESIPKSTLQDLEYAQLQIAKANKYAKESGNLEYFMSDYTKDDRQSNTPQGLYHITFKHNGDLNIKSANNGRFDREGYGVDKNGTPFANVRVHRGIEHRDLKDPRTGQAKTQSPAYDAKIKTYVMYGQEILDYIQSNMGGTDAYTHDSDTANHKSKTTDKNQHKYDKLTRFDNKETRKHDDTETELYSKRDKLNQEIQSLTRLTDKESRQRKKIVRQELKTINQQIKDYQYNRKKNK